MAPKTNQEEQLVSIDIWLEGNGAGTTTRMFIVVFIAVHFYSLQ